MKSFARAMHFPPIVKYIDTCARHTFLISWHEFNNGVTKYVDARVCDTIVNDSGAGASSSVSETRAQPYISVLSSSNSMHSVIHAIVQSCAAGARMTARVDTSEKRVFSCTSTKGCGETFTRKDNRDRHARTCKGPKTCPYCPHRNIYGGDIIRFVLQH